ncbi:hypothetical protein KEJ49_07130 [Candidatus Bathyarchaeota archaeon]|nr:hypothetical protein [Candidatus Bathyarchaeota archaeon]
MDEEETRDLLKVRDELERRIMRLQRELEDSRRALILIERMIVRKGFQKPTVPEEVEGVRMEEVEGGEEEVGVSIRGRDGTLLGHLRVEERDLYFYPREDLPFTESIPPFRAFLVEKVLMGMRASDEDRASRGEITPDEVLSFEVSTEDGRLKMVAIHNYGGERRLREIQSSLRWAFEKMYEKIGAR